MATASVINVTPKALCKRVFDASDGILAVGITDAIAPGGHSELEWHMATPDPYQSDPYQEGQWERVFGQLHSLFWFLPQTNVSNAFHLNTSLVSIVAERRHGWVVFVVVALGHPIRKSLRRMINKVFRDLTKPQTPKVIPLVPANSR